MVFYDRRGEISTRKVVNYEGARTLYGVEFVVNLGVDPSVFPQTSHQVPITDLKTFKAGPK
jgi:hypothetical protein